MNSLISQSLNEGDVHLLFGFPKQLMSKFETRVVEWIVSYTTRYGKPPTIERVSEQFDTFVSVTTSDPIGDIYDRTLTRKRNIYVREYLTRVQEKLKAGEDPLPYIEEVHTAIRGGRGDVLRYSTFDRSAYLRRATSFPYEIQEIDKHTGGIAQGDLIYLIGRLGTGKTTFALWVVSKWLQRERRILLVSNENRADDVIAKIDAYVGGFNPINKRTRQWSEDDVHRLATVSYIAKHSAGEVFIPTKPVQDTKEIASLIYTYRPDLVMIDGIYLMNGAKGDSHWEKITHISRELKQIAEGEGLPLLGIHQASRRAVGKRIEVEDIAYSDALGQDADLVLAINKEEDDSIFVQAIKNRWGDGEWGFFMKFFFDTMQVKILDGKVIVDE